MLFRLVRSYLRPYRKLIVIVCLLQLVQVMASLTLPGLNAAIIDRGVLTGDTPYIWRTGALMLLATVFQAVAMIVAVYLGAKAAMSLGRDLRRAVFAQVQPLSRSQMIEFGAPSLVTRATNDIQQVQQVVLMTLTLIVTAPFMGIGGVIMSIHQDPPLSGLLLVVVPLLAIIIGIAMTKLHPLFTTNQRRIDTLSTVLREQLTGVRVIRAFNRQESERARFEDANTQLRAVSLAIGRVFAFLFPVLMLINLLASVAVLWFGAIRIDAGGMQLGALLAFLNYLMQIFMAVMMTSMIFMLVPRAEVCAQRIRQVLQTDPDILIPANPKPLPTTALTFELDQVCLQFPGALAPVLSEVDLTLKPGTTTAVIGSTGSGKSTLVSLLPRLLDATSGTIRINGIPIAEFDPIEVRTRLALVPQKAYLLAGTVASSVSSLPTEEITAEVRSRVQTALDYAQAADFVAALPAGLDSPVESGGTNFSGGQRQRLTIARAFFRQADLIVFDDAFSALDTNTEAQLRTRLRKAAGEAAVLLVSQRIATVRDADHIVVLADGRAVGGGTHAELLASCATYREIVASQFENEGVA